MIHKHDPVTPLNNLFVKIDRSYGARTLGYDFLNALKQTLLGYRYNADSRKVKKCLQELSKAVYDSRPRIALILRYEKLIADFLQHKKSFQMGEIIDYIDQLIDETRVKTQEVVKHGASLIKKSSTILLHSRSNTVFKILNHAIAKGIMPKKVIIAAQEEQKTSALVRKIKELGVPFFVVPEYVISHIEQDIDFALFGALTYNFHHELVMSPGSAAVIAELHHMKIPCYVAMETDKFSLWKDQKKHHTLKSVHMHTTKDEYMCYEKLTFSHDRVPLNWITGLVTERGVCPPAKTKKIYSQLLAEEGR